jgi:hypothetical protein
MFVQSVTNSLSVSKHDASLSTQISGQETMSLVDLSPKMRQLVKTQNPLNGGLGHGIVSQAVH